MALLVSWLPVTNGTVLPTNISASSLSIVIIDGVDKTLFLLSVFIILNKPRISASLKNGPKGLEYEIQVTKDDIVLHTVKKKHRKKHRNTEAQIISGSQSYDLFFGEKGEWAWLKDQSKYKKAVAALGKTPKIDTEFSSVIEFTPHGGAGLGRGLKLLKSKCK